MRYSGGTIIHEQIDAGTRVSLINGLKNAAVNAGWSATGKYPFCQCVVSGLPNDGNTTAIDGVTYRFKNTLAAAYDVKIGATAEATINNWVDAVMDNSANEGVTYGTGTAAHPTCTAAKYNASTFRTYWKTAGPGSPFTVSGTPANFSWNVAPANYGGWKITNQRNEAGHYCWAHLIDGTNVYTTNVRVYFGDPQWDTFDESFPQGTHHELAPSTSRVLEVIGGRYCLWVCMLGTADPAAGVHLTIGTLYIRDFSRPRTVVSVSNNGGEIQVNLDADHGRVDGDHVNVAYGTGLAAINGRFEIAVVDSDSYVLKGSTYASGYDANSARAGGQEVVTRCFIGFGYASWGRWGLRDSCGIGLSGMTYGFNQFSYRHNAAQINMVRNYFINYAGGMVRIINLGGAADLLEARFGWTVTGSGQRFMVGEFYDAFLADAGVPIDTMLYDFDGRNWFCYCNGGDYSLWIAVGIAS